MVRFMDREIHGVKEGEAGGARGGRFWSTCQQLGRAVLEHVYPPACIACDAPTSNADGLCPACWQQLRPITAPLCPVLGLPFEVSIGPGALSAEAIANPPPFERARSALVHNNVARSIVSRLKFGDRPDLAKFCAHLMLGAGAELFRTNKGEAKPVLVPVPLHRRRQWQRRYNQSTELAWQLAKGGGMQVAPLVVVRTRATPPQIGLSAAQRARNVAGAFKAQPGLLELIGDRRVVIVDDVITTGSSVSAVARALSRAGVAHIDVISFSRVVLGDDANL